MGLYDRNYTTESSFSASNERSGALSSFIKQTYQLLAASLLAATAGAYIGLGLIPIIAKFQWLFIIAEFAMIIGLNFTKQNRSLSLVMLFAFTFISGLTIAPLVGFYIAASAANIVTNAFLLTTVAFGALSLFAFNTKLNLGSMGKFLFIALIVIVVASLINIFTQSSALQMFIAGAGALIFSGFILYDTQMIIRGQYDSPILAAVSLYLDVLNLFISLVQILGFLNNRD